MKDWQLRGLIEKMLTVAPGKRFGVGEMLKLEFFQGMAEKDSFF